MQIETVNILGVPVRATNMRNGVAQIDAWIQERSCAYVCITGVHGVMESQRSKKVLEVHRRASLVLPDGMPLVYIMRLAGHRNISRVYGPDLMLEICRESAARGYKHFFYGTTPSTLARLQDRLVSNFPGLRIVGSYAPPFRPLTPEEAATVCAQINASEPDIVWVGLSTPKQECWMAEIRAHLNAPVLIGVGAAFDFHAGIVPQSPRWMQPLCLEWLYRLVSEPRRLWKRYLVNNPQFLFLLALQVLRLKQFQ